jgi:Arc/MetJ family transcription regulator
MRTNIEIDDKLMAEAMRAMGAKTKREAVETALRRFVEQERRKDILKLRGKVNWVGDLDAMRRDA